MPILNAIKGLPKYTSYEADIDLVLKELFTLTGAHEDDQDSLILRRFEPIFANMDAGQAYHFLVNLKLLIVTPNSGSGTKPLLNAGSARGRAMKLLDKFCPISYEALVNVSNTDVDKSAILNLSARGTQLNKTVLEANRIYLDSQDFWYQSPYGDVLAPGSQSLTTSDSNNKVLEITDNDKVVDFTFLNNFIEFTHAVKAYPMVLSLPSEYLTPANLKKLKSSDDVFALCLHALKTHPKYAAYSDLDAKIAALSQHPESMKNFVKLVVAYPHAFALNQSLFSYVQIEKINNLPTLFLNSALGVSLVNALGVDGCIKLYESSASKDLLQLFHHAVSNNVNVKLNPVYLEDYMIQMRLQSSQPFMDRYANASPAFLTYLLPTAEKYNLIRPYDYAKYPVLSTLLPVQAEEATNKLRAIYATPKFAAMQQQFLAGNFSNSTTVLNQTQKAQELLAELSIRLESYKTSDKTRLEARSQLSLAMVQGLDAVSALLRKPEFREAAGYSANHRKRRLLKQVIFSDVCEDILHKAQAFIQKRNADRDDFIKAVSKDGQLLQAMLSDNDTYQGLIQDPKLLSEIYAAALAENKALFVQVIYDHRNAQTFPALLLSNGTRLTFNDIAQMVNVPSHHMAADKRYHGPKAWRAFNKLRHEFQLESIIPGDAVYAKVDSLAALEQLTAEEKHQLIDPDIAVGEYYLRTQYQHLLRNKVKDVVNQPIAKDVPDFYLLPAGNYMLIDPDFAEHANASAFRNFRKALPEYVNSVPQSHPAKPIVFLGVINVSYNHFISYFVYKNPNGTVQIITLDPSPRIYPVGTRSRKGELLDGKDIAIAQLKRMFENIFPGCEHTDLDVTQQLLQRDCGFNALQTLDDVLGSIGKPNSLLQINPSTGVLTIKTEGLTINGNADCGFNYSLGTYYYNKKLQQLCQQNRQIWANRFKAQSSYRLYIKTKEINHIDVADEILPLDYSYVENTATQHKSDKEDDNLSRLVGAMVSLPIWDSIEARFIREFKEPTADELTSMADDVTTLVGGQDAINALLPANQDLTVVLKNSARTNLYRHVVGALFTKFQAYLQNDSLKITENDTAQTLYSRFVSHANVKGFYERLSSVEKSNLQARINTYTNEQLNTSKIKYCNSLIARVLAILKKQENDGDLAAVISHFDEVSGKFKTYDMDSLKHALSGYKVLCAELDGWSSVASKEIIVSAINKSMSEESMAVIKAKINSTLEQTALSKQVSDDDNDTLVVVKKDDEIINDVTAKLKTALSPFFKNMLDEMLAAKKVLLTSSQDLIKNDFNLLVNVLQNASQALVAQGSDDAADKLKSYIEVLAKTLVYMNDWYKLSLGQVLEKISFHTRLLVDYKWQFTASLFSLYTAEDVMPRAVTKIARQAIAEMMRLPLAKYPTNEEIIAFDREVKALLVSYKLVDATSAVSVELPEVPENAPMLNTYGKKLNRALLTKLLDLWNISYRALGTNLVGVTPSQVKELINFVNEIPANIKDTENLPQATLDQLRVLVQDQVRMIDFANLQTVSPTQKLFLSILNSADFSPVRRVDNDAASAATLSINSIQHILNLYIGKEKHNSKNAEDFGAVSSSLLIEGSQISTVKTFFGGIKSTISLNPTAVLLQNVIQAIRGRHHESSKDFLFDYTDLELLMEFVARSNVIIAGEKLKTPTQRLFWALASVVSDELQKHGVKKTAAQIFGIHADIPLVSMTVPDAIAQAYGFDHGASVNCIAPQDLLCLNSGYCLDVGWLISGDQGYETTGNLINPYTGKDLGSHEIDSILRQSPAAAERLTFIRASRKFSLPTHADACIDNFVPEVRPSISASAI